MVMMARSDGSSAHTPPHGDHSPSHTHSLHFNKAQDIPSPMSMLATSRPPLSSTAPSGRSSLPPSLLFLQSPRSTPPPLDAVPTSPLSQSSVSFGASLSSSSAPWSAASSSLSHSRASSAMDLFTAPALTAELPTFSTLLHHPQSQTPQSPTSNFAQPDASTPQSNGGAGVGSSDSSEGEGEEVHPGGAPVRSKRRKLDEIPNRERWRCPNEGCGREYKRTSTTSIGQHKETCAKRPVFKARAIFQLSPSLHRPAHGYFPSPNLLTHAQAVGDLGRQLQQQGQIEGFGWNASDSGLQQRDSAALLGGLGGGATNHLHVQAAALLLAQQQMQQQTAQQLQAQLQLQQQQTFLQQQSQFYGQQTPQSTVPGSVSAPLFQSSAFDPSPLSYNSMLGMGVGSLSTTYPALPSLSDPFLGQSTSSLSSSLAASTSVGASIHNGEGVLSQLSTPAPSPLRHSPVTSSFPSMYAGGHSSSALYEMSGHSSYPGVGLTSATSQLLSEMPISGSTLPTYSTYSAYPPAVPLAPVAPQLPPMSHHSNHSALSLMKPVARRADDGQVGGAGSAMMGGLSSLSLQQLRNIGLGDYRQ